MQASRNWPIVALGLMAALFLFPLWAVGAPAMPDYPAHLAGFHLIRTGTDSLTPYYAVHWRLLPNLASDILVPLFAQVLPLEAAVKLFLSIAVAMWVTGAALIQRAVTGRIGAAALAGALFTINANFTWGFLNYTFASGLAFLIFAAWIATRGRRSPLVLAGFTLGVLALYVSHLFGVCVLVVLIGTFELGAVLRDKDFAWRPLLKRAVAPVAIFIPAGFLALFFKSAGGEGGGVEFNYTDSIGDRFGSAVQWAFSDPAYLVIGSLAILILAGLAYGKLRIHPALKLVVLTMAVLTMVAPEWALGGWGVDMRLPPVLGVITFASLELRSGKRLAMAFGAVVVLLAGLNAGLLYQSWHGYDVQFREFRTAIAAMPKGAKIFTVLDGDALKDISDPPYWHMAEFAIVDRDGFTPLMFATKGQHVIEVKAPFDRLAATTAKQGSPPDATELADLALGRSANDSDIDEVFPYLKFFQCHFDYAVIIHGGGEQAEVPAFMHMAYAGSFFSLYKIRRTPLCATQ